MKFCAFAISEVDIFFLSIVVGVMILIALIVIIGHYINSKRFKKYDQERMEEFKVRMEAIQEKEKAREEEIKKKREKYLESLGITETSDVVTSPEQLDNTDEKKEEALTQEPVLDNGEELNKPVEEDNKASDSKEEVIVPNNDVEKEPIVEEKPQEAVEEPSVKEEVKEPILKEEEETRQEEVKEPVKKETKKPSVKKEEKPQEVKKEPVKKETKPQEVKKEPVKKEEKPQEVKKEPVKKETKPQEVKKEPVKKEEKPQEVKKEPVKKETKPQEVKKEPVKKEEKPQEVKKEPVKKEEKPETEKTGQKRNAETKPTKKTPKRVEEEPTSNRYSGKFELFFEDGYYRYRLKASNGEVLFVSELYSTLQTAQKSIEAVKNNVVVGSVRIICDKRGKYKFELKANNHRTLAIGANYSTEKGAISSFESFKRFAETAEIHNVGELQDDEKVTSLEPARLDDVEYKNTGKYEIVRDDGEFLWFLKANNGEKLACGEGYSSKDGCLNALNIFRENVEEGNFFIAKDKNDSYQFKLYNRHNRLVCIGESYSTKAQANSSVNSVRAFSRHAIIVEA